MDLAYFLGCISIISMKQSQPIPCQLSNFFFQLYIIHSPLDEGSLDIHSCAAPLWRMYKYCIHKKSHPIH